MQDKDNLLSFFSHRGDGSCRFGWRMQSGSYLHLDLRFKPAASTPSQSHVFRSHIPLPILCLQTPSSHAVAAELSTLLMASIPAVLRLPPSLFVAPAVAQIAIATQLLSLHVSSMFQHPPPRRRLASALHLSASPSLHFLHSTEVLREATFLTSFLCNYLKVSVNLIFIPTFNFSLLLLLYCPCCTLRPNILNQSYLVFPPFLLHATHRKLFPPLLGLHTCYQQRYTNTDCPSRELYSVHPPLWTALECYPKSWPLSISQTLNCFLCPTHQTRAAYTSPDSFRYLPRRKTAAQELLKQLSGPTLLPPAMPPLLLSNPNVVVIE